MKLIIMGPVSLVLLVRARLSETKPSESMMSQRGRRSLEDVYETWASSAAARKTMQGNRGRDTKAEIAVRRLVHASGLRYQVNARPEKDLLRTADLLFTRVRVAVFIDGCYWHGCPQHFTMPATNLAYWSTKIGRNQERDRGTTSALEARAWWCCASGSTSLLRTWRNGSR